MLHPSKGIPRGAKGCIVSFDRAKPSTSRPVGYWTANTGILLPCYGEKKKNTKKAHPRDKNALINSVSRVSCASMHILILIPKFRNGDRLSQDFAPSLERGKRRADVWERIRSPENVSFRER